MDDYLRFVTYMKFDKLESLLTKKLINDKNTSNKWERLHLYRFSTGKK